MDRYWLVRQIDIQKDEQLYRQINGWMERWIEIQKDKQLYRQMDSWIDQLDCLLLYCIVKNCTVLHCFSVLNCIVYKCTATSPLLYCLQEYCIVFFASVLQLVRCTDLFTSVLYCFVYKCTATSLLDCIVYKCIATSLLYCIVYNCTVLYCLRVYCTQVPITDQSTEPLRNIVYKAWNKLHNKYFLSIYLSKI